jgi:dTDP-4-dehydrorhamnose reductase
MSWYGFSQKILEQAKKGPSQMKVKSIQLASSDEFKTVAKRPINSQLSCSKIPVAFKL